MWLRSYYVSSFQSIRDLSFFFVDENGDSDTSMFRLSLCFDGSSAILRLQLDGFMMFGGFHGRKATKFEKQIF